MSYSEFLADIIKNSKKSLRQISLECKNKYNVKATASYLSKLQTGGQTPASDNVNVAVAKVCGINPDDLLFEANLERAPEDVKKLVDTMVNFIKSMYLSFKGVNETNNQEIENEINKYLNMNTREFLKSMLENNNIDFENPLEIDIPLQEEQQNTVNDLFMKFSIGFKMLDNSMFPVIREGAKIELDTTAEIKDGDIVAVMIDNDKYLIRTYIKAGKNIILIPSNKDFETLTFKESDIDIRGKVKSITIDL